MHPSFWTSLFGGRDAETLSRGRLSARVAQSAVLGFVAAFVVRWLYDLVMGNDFSVDDAMSAAVGAAIGLAAVVLVNNRQRARRADPGEDDSFDDLPKRLG